MTILAKTIYGEGPDLDYLKNFPLIESDGEPLESAWHFATIHLLIQSMLRHWRDRQDFYVGGNMFVYYDLEQASTLSCRGPDFFFVKNVPLHPHRRFWAAWFEGGRYPNLIIELLSPKTAMTDRTTKKDIYEQIFRTAEYFLYDPATHQLEGWRLGTSLRYVRIEPDERGCMWSEQLGLWLGSWQGTYDRQEGIYLRFYDTNGQLVITREEDVAQEAQNERQRAESERQRAETQRQRADAAEAEIARLKALLAQQQALPEGQTGPSL